jgi:hypothetical protein
VDASAETFSRHVANCGSVVSRSTLLTDAELNIELFFWAKVWIVGKGVLGETLV